MVICFLGFMPGIQRNFFMDIVLSCVALVATAGLSASAKVALTGVILICLVIALPACT